jgi:hypothetical protein
MIALTRAADAAALVRRPRLVGLLTLGMLILARGPLSAADATYPTPEAAMAAFRAAIYGEGGKGILDLFGREYEADLVGGNPVDARQNIEALRRMAAQRMTLEPDGEGRMTIIMGRRGWPMPIPLVKGKAGWSFDVKAGVEEITDRRIGRNELAAIEFCKTYIDAQRQYAGTDHDGDGLLKFAQRLRSSEGHQDGLYWHPGPDGVASPLGAFAAAAERDLAGRNEGGPFRGYYFRILTAQGANPPGGAYNYVINGNMIAGFALIAWPADYGRSGIMTFECSHHGQVWEKDLGPDTGNIAAAITQYDPDGTWQLAE